MTIETLYTALAVVSVITAAAAYVLTRKKSKHH